MEPRIAQRPLTPSRRPYHPAPVAAPPPSRAQALADEEAALIERAQRVRQMRIRAAYHDVNEFVRYVIRDETTHEPVIQAPIHEEIQANFAKHKRFAMITAPEIGKTWQAIAYVLWLLGRNPELRFAIVSENVNQANKTIKVIKTYIEESVELHHVFPNLRPGKKWTESALFVRRKSSAKDPSVTSYAPGKNITGARIDGMVIDDLVSAKNTLTKHRRDLMFDYVMRTLENRLGPEGWIVFLANAWHPDDALHRLARSAAAHKNASGTSSELAWHVERYPVLKPDGTSIWEERWPMSRIREKKQGYIEAGAEREWVRQFLCIAREDTDARFTEAAINNGLQFGREITLIREIEHLTLPPGLDPQLPGMPPKLAYDPPARMKWVQQVLAHHAATKTPPPFIITVGVDLAVRRHSKADLTALVALCTLPSGHRIVLDVKAGRFSWSQICGHIIDFNDRFAPQVILVENVAAQDYVLQHIRDICDAPVMGYTTGQGKADPSLGLESIAGLLESGWLVLPGSPTGTVEGVPEGSEMRALTDDMLFYSPASHVGDRLMALWFAETAVKMMRRRMTKVEAVCIGGAFSMAEKMKHRALLREAEERLAGKKADMTPSTETERRNRVKTIAAAAGAGGGPKKLGTVGAKPGGLGKDKAEVEESNIPGVPRLGSGVGPGLDSGDAAPRRAIRVPTPGLTPGVKRVRRSRLADPRKGAAALVAKVTVEVRTPREGEDLSHELDATPYWYPKGMD